MSLREEIAKSVGRYAHNCYWDVCSAEEKEAAYREADFILSVIIEAVGKVENLYMPFTAEARIFEEGRQAIIKAIKEGEMKGIPFTPDMVQAIIAGHKTQMRRLSGLKEVNKEPDRWKFVGYDDGVPAFQSLERYIHVKLHYLPGETVYVKTGPKGYFLPAREASHFLKILTAEAQRLQEITPADCFAEGIEDIGKGVGRFNGKYGMARTLYAELWNATYPRHPWTSNPWLWRLVVKLAERPESAGG